MVDHQAVAFRVPEERHVADTGVEGVALELDARSLELRAGFPDVRHADGDRPEGRGSNSSPNASGTTTASVTLSVSNSGQSPPVSGFSRSPSVSA